MTLMLDTSVLIDLYQGKEETVKKLEEKSDLHPENPTITFANFAEFYQGFEEKDKKEKQRAEEFLNKFTYLKSSPRTAKRFSELKHRLEEEGKKIPLLDIYIASIAIENRITVITRDKHFKEIEELETILV
ncbi:MAG: PIN domain-containing protein [Candidatus Nanohaloarchaeota archaeon QJJ-9]|nr:PIN domain-containing protein [Candidatus Nanohaloarchaeota archaeon QJJ-9]